MQVLVNDYYRSAIKPDIIKGILAYVQYGECGSFLQSVMENNLLEAVCRADDDNIKAIVDIVKFVHWEIPGACHGSAEKVKAWRAARRLEREQAEPKTCAVCGDSCTEYAADGEYVHEDCDDACGAGAPSLDTVDLSALDPDRQTDSELLTRASESVDG